MYGLQKAKLLSYSFYEDLKMLLQRHSRTQIYFILLNDRPPLARSTSNSSFGFILQTLKDIQYSARRCTHPHDKNKGSVWTQSTNSVVHVRVLEGCTPSINDKDSILNEPLRLQKGLNCHQQNKQQL